MLKKYGFSMAEMLIAIVLIGVIVILLLLGLRHNGIKTTLNKAHYDKLYTELSNASKSILSFDKTMKGSFPKGITSSVLKEKFLGQFNVSDANVSMGLDSALSELLNEDSSTRLSGFSTENGTSYGFHAMTDEQAADFVQKYQNLTGENIGSAGSIVGVIVVDVDGASSGRNTYLDDRYIVVVKQDGVYAPDEVSPTEVLPSSVAFTCADISFAHVVGTCSGTNTSCCTCQCEPGYSNGGCGSCYKDCSEEFLEEYWENITEKVAAGRVVNSSSEDCFVCDEGKKANCQTSGGSFDDITCECICPDGTDQNTNNYHCCPEGQIRSGSECVCEDPTKYLVNGECIDCVEPKEIVNGNCVCPAGKIGTACDNSYPNKVYDSECNCTCPHAAGTSCDNSNPNKVYDSNCNCTCSNAEGTACNNNLGHYNSNCECQCNSDSATCANGLAGASFNDSTCECSCPSHSHLTNNNTVCECDAKYLKNDATSSCLCNPDEFVKECSEDQYVDASNECACTPCDANGYKTRDTSTTCKCKVSENSGCSINEDNCTCASCNDPKRVPHSGRGLDAGCSCDETRGYIENAQKECVCDASKGLIEEGGACVCDASKLYTGTAPNCCNGNLSFNHNILFDECNLG